MKIRIKEDRKTIIIPVPTGLIFSKTSVWIWLKLAKLLVRDKRKYIPEDAQEQLTALLENLPEEGIQALCAEIMRIKRTYGSFRLVEVYAADDKEVIIDL